MSLKIIIQDDISLANLITIYRNGGRVLKTPHIGNIYPNNLAIALLGIPILFYDRTVGKKDISFHPHKVIFTGKSEVIGDPNKLTTHSVVINSAKNLPIPVILGSRLTDLHFSSFLKAIPSALCFTYTEYIQKNKEKVLQILEAVTNLRPALWNRVVDKEGITSQVNAKNWSDIITCGIYGVTNMESGWIIPNPISILFHCTIDIFETNVNDSYLLSGPDMFRYIDGYQEKLNEIYDHLRISLDWNLPEVINCHIVPVLNMRFIVENKNKNALDDLVSLYLEFISIESLLKQVATRTKEDLGNLIYEKNEIKQKILYCISKNFSIFSKTVFYNIEEQNCFSQYDLLKSDGLYIHPWAIDSKLSDVSKAFSFLSRLYFLIKEQLQEEI